MPRPPRCRRICGAPQVDTFCPNGCENTKPILLTLDEYEVIRLVDLEQQTHEQCAGCMSFGKAGTMHDWTLDETEKVVKHALETLSSSPRCGRH